MARVQGPDSYSPDTISTGQKYSSNNNSSSPPPHLQIENVFIFNAIQSLKPNIDNPKLLTSKSLTEFLSDYFPNHIDDTGEVIPQVLIFDQLEELFNYSAKKWKEQQEVFFKQISQALNNNTSLRIAFIIHNHLAKINPFQSLLLEKVKTPFKIRALERGRSHISYQRTIRKNY